MNIRIVRKALTAGMIAPGICSAGLLAVVFLGAAVGCSDTPPGSSQTNPPPGDSQRTTIGEDEIRAALDAAEQYFNAGDNANARMILARLVRDTPKELAAREFLGQVHSAEAVQHEAAGRHEAAQSSRASAWEQYRQAVALAPDQAGLHHSAALIALAANERDAAVELLHEAVRLDPAQTQYPLYLAQLLIQDGLLDEAEQLTIHALSLDPDEPHLHATRAAIELERGSHERALGHIREARTIAPNENAFRVQEAKILRRWNRPQEALALLTSLTGTELSQEYVAWEVAANYEILGESVLVAQTWERCFRANPLHANAWEWAVRVGEALVRADRASEATLWLEHARRLNPAAPEVQALDEAIRKSG